MWKPRKVLSRFTKEEVTGSPSSSLFRLCAICWDTFCYYFLVWRILLGWRVQQPVTTEGEWLRSCCSAELRWHLIVTALFPQHYSMIMDLKMGVHKHRQHTFIALLCFAQRHFGRAALVSFLLLCPLRFPAWAHTRPSKHKSAFCPDLGGWFRGVQDTIMMPP